MIKRCAKFEEKSVEQWILLATEGDLRSEAGEFGYRGINVGFGNKEIDDVINTLQSGGAA